MANTDLVNDERCIVIVFFFFQAEDGIRDYKVTGVQTCALPISRTRARCTGSESHGNALAFALIGKELPASGLSVGGSIGWAKLRALDGVDLLYRSEERRVGKECRSRWSPYH